MRNDSDVEWWLNVITGDHQVKWYSHTRDMQAVSKEWPEALFTLRGYGEERDEVWAEYHQDGKVQRETRPTWAPPPFDSEKLTLR